MLILGLKAKVEKGERIEGKVDLQKGNKDHIHDPQHHLVKNTNQTLS